MDQPDLDRHRAAGLTFGELPDEAARRFGDREALAFRGRRYSFRQIAGEVDRLARGLIHVGIAPGEKVCLWLANCPEWAYRARKVLAPLRHLTAYGITEVGANVSMSDLDATDEQACETSGRACPGFELRVIDPATGRDQPPGAAGELLVRTRYRMQGYYGKPEETARALDAEGWFHTGDMALLRPDGYMRFIGRYKDMLKVGGENVDPMEVDAYLLRHPAVRGVAVVGYPDARLTEVPVAFVIRRDGAAAGAQEILAAVKLRAEARRLLGGGPPPAC